MALVELSVMEQRYRAVLEVEAGCPVTEVAARHGVSRQSVHAWAARYRTGGLAALADRSHRPQNCPHQIPAEVEALVCELRRAHPRWGPVRLAFELEQRGAGLVPSLATLYRVLARNTLIVPEQRRRPRSSYIRWEREEPMALWQMDIMGGVFLACGRELKLVSGLDDHSRYGVIARLVIRATGRSVCAAFVAAMDRYGVPSEVLTDIQRQAVHQEVHPAAPRRGAVRADLPGERHHHPADQATDPYHDGQGRTLAQDPAGGVPGRPRPVRQPRACPGRAGRLGRGLQPSPAAPVAGHGHPRQPVPCPPGHRGRAS